MYTDGTEDHTRLCFHLCSDGRRAGCGPCAVGRLTGFRQTEIKYFHRAVRAHLDVRRLQITIPVLLSAALPFQLSRASFSSS